MKTRIKTEHNGAKNGGGHWGRRAEAKALSSKLRRENAKADIRASLDEALVREVMAANAPKLLAIVATVQVAATPLNLGKDRK